MTSLHLHPGAPHARRAAACIAVFAAVVASAGCAGMKDQYAATADAQQRMAAEAATESKAGANVDTRETYLKLVGQMQQEGLWFASLAHIDALEQRWGVSAESNRFRADALRQTDQAAASEAAYKRLMGTPLEGAGYRGLGLLAGARGNFAEAMQMLQQAQRRTPTDALLLSDLGYASLRAGRLDDARLPLMQALQLKPDSTQAQSNLALYFVLSNQDEQADALMASSRMPEAARAAVRDAAQQLRAGGIAPPAVAAAAAPAQRVAFAARDDAPAPPLALKASRWSATATAMSQIPASPNSTSTARGTP